MLIDLADLSLSKPIWSVMYLLRSFRSAYLYDHVPYARPVPYEYICSRSLSSVCKVFPATSLLNSRVMYLAKTILDMILSFPDYPFRVPFHKSFFIGVSWFSSFIWPPKLYSTTNIIICHYTAGIKLFYPRLLQAPHYPGHDNIHQILLLSWAKLHSRGKCMPLTYAFPAACSRRMLCHKYRVSTHGSLLSVIWYECRSFPLRNEIPCMLSYGIQPFSCI